MFLEFSELGLEGDELELEEFKFDSTSFLKLAGTLEGQDCQILEVPT